MTTEEWRPVVGQPGYRISSLGRVESNVPRAKGSDRSAKILRPGLTTAGYPTVVLHSPGMPHRTRYVHHLVAEAFIGPRPAGLEIRHMDGDPENCTVENLRYGSTSDNAYDRVRHGTHVQSRKTKCAQGHPFDEANTRQTERQRICRACRRIQGVAYRQRQMLAAANVRPSAAA